MGVTSVNNGAYHIARFYIPNLTPGQSYNWDWIGQTGTTGSVTQTLTILTTNLTNGVGAAAATGAGAPAMMRVLSA